MSIPDYVTVGVDPRCLCEGKGGEFHNFNVRCGVCQFCKQRIKGMYLSEHESECWMQRKHGSSRFSGKEIAQKLIDAMHAADQPYGSHRLAQLAGVPYSSTVVAVLETLNKAGKIEKVKVGPGRARWRL